MFRNAFTALFAAGFGVALAAQSQSDAACRISGVARGAGVVLPGVSISVIRDSVVRVATATSADGSYRLTLPPGTYQVRAELTGFDRVERELMVSPPPACEQTLDLLLALTPRRPAAADGRDRGPAAAARAGTPGQRFQRVDVQQERTAPENTDQETIPQEALLLPPGFSADAAGDAIAVNGSAARLDNGLLNDRNNAIARGEFQLPPGLDGGAASGGFGQAGADGQGPGGAAAADGVRGGADGARGRLAGAGGRGGAGGGRGGRGGALAGRGVQPNRVNVTADYTFGGSALDAAPYQLRPDSPAAERPYTQQNFGTTVGGRLRIPGLLSGTRTNFTVTYNGGRGATLFDQYGTVPTAALRAGDFSTLATTLIDPASGQPFPGNRIPADRISSQAGALLQFIPLPNLPGTERNYHYTTTTASRNDAVNARITHVFTGEGARGAGPGGRGGGAAGFRGRGAGNGRGTSIALNAQLQFRHTDADQANTFSTLGGARTQTSLGIPIGLNIAKGRQLHNVNLNFSHSSSDSTNRFAGVQNITSLAGIVGASSDPFAWGVPNLSFSSLTGLRDVTPSQRSDRRLSADYSWTHPLRRHQLRFGGNVQADRTTSDTEANANGTFIFTGLYASGGTPVIRGADFADFLLGMPQQASVQYGPGAVTLKGRSVAAFVNDDWRVNGRITVQMGLRYELLWPFIEQSGHLVNLDVTPGFTAAAPVLADGTGPFTGSFPDALLKTDRNNLAPRLGLAWRAGRRTVVRGGFGTSYNNGTYSAIARQLASQPPFASTNTNIGTLSRALLLENALSGVAAEETTNTYGIDKDYVLGRVDTYNADVNQQLGRVWTVGANYTYTRGSNLDVARAPNRGPTGLRIEGVQPFLWETAEGSSVLHSGTFRLQRRQVRGLGGGVTYTLARSRDNAPSIGGGGVGSASIVAQNDQDLGAEWALSSFDRRHRINGNINYDLPFGPNRRWLNGGGRLAAIVESWRVTATLLLDSGTPLTARVQNATRDVAQGINGALRADYNGGPIAAGHPTIDQFFNTGAFSIPAAGAFGTSPRNVIIGPGSRQVNAQISRDVRLGSTRALTIQMRINNLLNNVNFAAVDTNVNSPTFGDVLSVRSMRSAQLNLRFRF
jgi:hypothetical protein